MSKQRIKLFCIALLVATGSLNTLNSAVSSKIAIAIPHSDLTQVKENDRVTVSFSLVNSFTKKL